MMSIIQELKTEGALVLYHDYRRRDVLDLSGNSNDGTLTAVNFGRNGASFPGTTSKILVAHNVNQQITEGTFVFYFPDGIKNKDGNVQRLIEKSSSTDYDLYLAADLSGMVFVDGGSNPQVVTNLVGKKYLAVTFKTGEIPELYLDGVFVSNFSIICSVGTSTADITLFNRDAGSRQNFNTCGSTLIINRQLTATEHAELYGELSSLSFPSKVSDKFIGVYPNVLTDGDMEATGTSDWNAAGSATLSKDKGVIHGGSQSIKMTGTGSVNFGAYQTALTVGKEYRMTGYFKTDGTTSSKIYSAPHAWSVGTAVGYWRKFNYTFTAQNTNIQFYSAGSTGNIWYDDLVISETGKTLDNGWKTDWAANVSDGNVTAGFLENTPFTVGSGTFKVVSDTINGDDVKAIECISTGILSIPSSYFGQTPTEAAYGEWDFWLSKAETTNIRLLYIASAPVAHDDASQTGYYLHLTSGESLDMAETTNGSLASKFTSSNAIVADTFYKVCITRSSAGVFTTYLNDVQVVESTGDNPFTDAAVTTSNYMVFSMGAGDKVALGDLSGNYSIIKKVI